ncbi:FAD binding domain-containing protein [Actinomycetospora soli]|uniref:FAD binding domain-containing protein n=1 Tax=Actinomycetospora soli TaxID=2893887 RepID=UPI001E45F289|nr:FAD binding domain-containing protein [Actinomycetospora soli]MCD2191488.1 FAD binding domain-containing protein [Actinomycetospora soli]
MKPPRFLYCDPDTLEEAVALKSQHEFDALVLAGGQSLMPMLNMRLAGPEVLIDINGVTDLQHIGRINGTLEIGAGVRQSVLEAHSEAAVAVPLIAAAMPHIGHIENRHRGTVGGSIAHADAAAELPCTAVTLDAVIVVRSERGERQIAATDFFQGFLTNACEPDELVVAIRYPVTSPTAGSAFTEFARREGDFALASAGAVAEVDADGRFTSVAIGVGSITTKPVRARAIEEALLGRAATSDVIKDAARQIGDAVTLSSDMHATSRYRRHLATTVVTRAVAAAAADAQNRSAS